MGCLSHNQITQLTSRLSCLLTANSAHRQVCFSDLSLVLCTFPAEETVSRPALWKQTQPTHLQILWQENGRGMVTLPIQEVFQVLHVPSVKVFKFKRKIIFKTQLLADQLGTGGGGGKKKKDFNLAELQDKLQSS